MHTPQGAQLTGTNTPNDLTTPTHPRIHYPTPKPHTTTPTNTNQPHNNTKNLWGVAAVTAERETPGPIPNPDVKPSSADGTAHTVWESRTPPTHPTPQKRGPTKGALFLFHRGPKLNPNTHTRKRKR
jgi:hypothetical protein